VSKKKGTYKCETLKLLIFYVFLSSPLAFSVSFSGHQQHGTKPTTSKNEAGKMWSWTLLLKDLI